MVFHTQVLTIFPAIRWSVKDRGGNLIIDHMQREDEAKMQNVFKSSLQKRARMGFEPTRAEHIGLAVQRLNHSATSSIRDN